MENSRLTYTETVAYLDWLRDVDATYVVEMETALGRRLYPNVCPLPGTLSFDHRSNTTGSTQTTYFNLRIHRDDVRVIEYDALLNCLFVRSLCQPPFTLHLPYWKSNLCFSVVGSPVDSFGEGHSLHYECMEDMFEFAAILEEFRHRGDVMVEIAALLPRLKRLGYLSRRLREIVSFGHTTLQLSSRNGTSRLSYGMRVYMPNPLTSERKEWRTLRTRSATHFVDAELRRRKLRALIA